MEWETLKRIIEQRESQEVEFKPTSFLSDKNEMASQIVAFANRSGGKVLIGVLNDGTLEGKRINSDKASLFVLDVAHHKCSPSAEVTIDYCNSERGDVLIVDTARRRSMPIAVIDREGQAAEIKARTYYIRTENRKRLVDDDILRFMFEHTIDPHLQGNFRICFWYDRASFNFFPFEFPNYLTYTLPFMQNLTKGDIKFLSEKESTRVQSFITEILPYAMLLHFSMTFSNSWLVQIERRHGEMTWGPRRTDVQSRLITYSDIPLKKGTVSSQLFGDITSDLKNFFRDFRLPQDTTIEIDVGNQEIPRSSLKLRNPFFELETTFVGSMWVVGLPFPVVAEPFLDPLQVQKRFAQSIIRTTFDGKFAFPDANDTEFEDHFFFGKTVLDMLQHDWDWETETKRISERRIHSMSQQVGKMLEILQKRKV